MSYTCEQTQSALVECVPAHLQSSNALQGATAHEAAASLHIMLLPSHWQIIESGLRTPSLIAQTKAQLCCLQSNNALQGAAAQQALAQAAANCAATVLLADPGEQAETGLVLSLAPLLGADPQLERAHPRWLHIHVRPPVRGLLKVLKVKRFARCELLCALAC